MLVASIVGRGAAVNRTFVLGGLVLGQGYAGSAGRRGVPRSPTRELLAELLLERGHLRRARQAFEAQLHAEPRRLNALYGAAHTAELTGDLAEAAGFYEGLLALCAEGASRDAPFAQARAFLANINLER
jgi:hypothetical protein